MNSKRKIRSNIVKKLRDIPNNEYHSIYDKLFNSYQWENAKTIAITINTSIEINTRPIIKKGIEQNKQIVIPKTLPNRKMYFVRLTKKIHLKYNKYNIMEPINGDIIDKNCIDLIIVPGLAFAISTNDRLGFGGGYYDRYLSNYNGNTIALSRKVQNYDKPIWPVDKYDIKMNKIITE